MENWIALLVGVTTAIVALLGYLLTEASKRRESDTGQYARALEAVKEFEELPYRISRRPAADAATRSALGKEMSDAYVKMEFHRNWLAIHSPVAAAAYAILVSHTHAEIRPLIRVAWERPPLAQDSENHLSGVFDRDSKGEWDLVVWVMRRELSLLAPVLRRGTRRGVRRFAAKRRTPPMQPEPESASRASASS